MGAPMLMDMEMEELDELWKENKVVKVDRKVVKDEERQNASLIITFKDTKIPHHLYIAGNWVTVKKFRKKLLQCQKCNKMYHIAKCARAITTVQIVDANTQGLVNQA